MPFVNDFPRRRSFCIAINEDQNEAPFMRFLINANDEHNKGWRKTSTIRQQLVDDPQSSPNEAPNRHAGESVGNGFHGIWRNVHQVWGAHPVPDDLPRRRSFYIEHKMEQVDVKRITSETKAEDDDQGIYSCSSDGTFV